jgi:cation transport regulator ChaB
MVLNKKEKERLPATLKRSPAKAQATYMHTLESAEQDHGDGEAAHRIAFGSLKHSFEKVGDHWEPKNEAGQDRRRSERAGHQDASPRGGHPARHPRPVGDVKG